MKVFSSSKLTKYLTSVPNMINVLLLFVFCSLVSLTRSDHAVYSPRSRVSKPSSEHLHILTPYNFHIVEDTFRMSRVADSNE